MEDLRFPRTNNRAGSANHRDNQPEAEKYFDRQSILFLDTRLIAPFHCWKLDQSQRGNNSMNAIGVD